MLLKKQKSSARTKNHAIITKKEAVLKKILNILPNSIAGTLILRGFGAGFRANGMYVLEKDFRELKIEDIKIFKPDMIFGYDYGFLMSENADLRNFIKENFSHNSSFIFHGPKPKNPQNKKR